MPSGSKLRLATYAAPSARTDGGTITYPPSPRTLIPSPLNRPSLLVTGRAGSHLNQMCLPSVGVIVSRVGACPPCSATSFSQASTPLGDIVPIGAPLTCFGLSRSTTQNPDVAPVLTPIIASGRRAHQSRIVAESHEAFFRPPELLTLLRSGPRILRHKLSAGPLIGRVAGQDVNAGPGVKGRRLGEVISHWRASPRANCPGQSRKLEAHGEG